MGNAHIKAHFDGEKILLDEPYKLEPDTKLIVTVLPKDQKDFDREDWMLLSKNGLENAYGKNEPNYSPDLIKEENPDYERR